MKDVHIRGEEVCPMRTFCGQRWRGVLPMRTSALFCCKKHRIFRNLWCVRADREGSGL